MSKYVKVDWPESQKWMDQKYYDEGVEFSQSCGTTVFVPEELYNGFFEVTAVSRADLKAAGFMADEVDDKIMERLASKMADAYVESSFWTDLEIIAEELGIKREEERTVHTCMGEFVICQSGKDLWAEPMPTRDEVYPLPMPDMTNEEIKDYFRILKEEEE